MTDHSTPRTEKERDMVRKIILDYFGDETQCGVRYVRSTETWFGICPDCSMWVRDRYASMEVAVGVWVGRWAQATALPLRRPSLT